MPGEDNSARARSIRRACAAAKAPATASAMPPKDEAVGNRGHIPTRDLGAFIASRLPRRNRAGAAEDALTRNAMGTAMTPLR